MNLRAALRVAMPVALITVASCTGRRGPGPIEDTSPRPTNEESASPTATVQAVYDFGMSFGTTRRELQSGLGQPEKVEIELAANRHDPSATDSLYVLHYPGLRFSLNRPGPVGRDLLTEVVLTAHDREVPGGIRPGATQRGIVDEILGSPESTISLADTLVLVHATPNPGAEEYVQFYVLDGVIERIRWIPYVD